MVERKRKTASTASHQANKVGREIYQISSTRKFYTNGPWFMEINVGHEAGSPKHWVIKLTQTVNLKLNMMIKRIFSQ